MGRDEENAGRLLEDKACGCTVEGDFDVYGDPGKSGAERLVGLSIYATLVNFPISIDNRPSKSALLENV